MLKSANLLKACGLKLTASQDLNRMTVSFSVEWSEMPKKKEKKKEEKKEGTATQQPQQQPTQEEKKQ